MLIVRILSTGSITQEQMWLVVIQLLNRYSVSRISFVLFVGLSTSCQRLLRFRGGVILS